jgi:hypothetical protein
LGAFRDGIQPLKKSLCYEVSDGRDACPTESFRPRRFNALILCAAWIHSPNFGNAGQPCKSLRQKMRSAPAARSSAGKKQRKKDRRYWLPLKKTLEKLRHGG